MSKSSTTVRDVFEIPKPGEAESSEGWKAFRERLTNEVKGFKTAAMPDIAAKVGELLDVPIPNIFLSSWKKTNALKDLLEESKKSPEAIMNLELGEHTINSQHHPHIEVKIQKTPVKKMEFTLKLIFNLKGFVLKVQNGAITEMQTGSCEGRGTLEYQGLIIVDRKLAPIALPGTVRLEKLIDAGQPAAVVKTEGTPQPQQVEEVKKVVAAPQAPIEPKVPEVLKGPSLGKSEAPPSKIEAPVPAPAEAEAPATPKEKQDEDREQLVL